MAVETPYPTQLEVRGDNALLIRWSDQTAREYSFRELRDACPCATCRELRKESPAAANPLQVLSSAEARPLKITGMTPVGNYAYTITYSDGHDTGIYTFEHLRELGRASE